ncbi:hypothetical protein [Bacillus spizizenii]
MATPYEIGKFLKESQGGNGETVVREYHLWKSGVAKGTTDEFRLNGNLVKKE